MTISWEAVLHILRKATVLVVDDITVGAMVVHAHTRDERVFLESDHSGEVYCYLRAEENQNVAVSGSNIWLTAHDGGDPIQVAAFRPWNIEADPNIEITIHND